MADSPSIGIEKQSVGWAIALSVILILAGLLAIVVPLAAGIGVAIVIAWLLVLGGVVAWALTMISIKKLGNAGERNATIVLWYCLGSLVLSLALSLPVWITPSPRDTALLLAAGLATAGAQLLMTDAYRSGETTLTLRSV